MGQDNGHLSNTNCATLILSKSRTTAIIFGVCLCVRYLFLCPFLQLHCPKMSNARQPSVYFLVSIDMMSVDQSIGHAHFLVYGILVVSMSGLV